MRSHSNNCNGVQELNKTVSHSSSDTMSVLQNLHLEISCQECFKSPVITKIITIQYIKPNEQNNVKIPIWKMHTSIIKKLHV